MQLFYIKHPHIKKALKYKKRRVFRLAVNFDLSACSKLTSLLLWLYDTVRICCFCDEAATARLQFKTDSVKLLRFRFHLL